MTGTLMSIPGQTMGVSVFTNHLIEDLNMERVDLSLAYLMGTLISGFIITYAGILYDRAGARIIAMGSGIFLGIMLFYLTRVDQIALFAGRVFPGASPGNIMLIIMTIGFFGIRFFGQGVMTMTSRNMVMKWFDKRRGFANGIMSIFVAFGFSYSPRLLQDLIDRWSWKGAWEILALIAGIAFVLFAFALFRDNPEDAGLIPDGKKLKSRNTRFKSTPERDYTLKEAIRTYSFWLFNMVLTMFALYATAFTFHVESIFAKVGYDKETAVSVFLPASVIAVVISFLSNWLSDYIRLKYFLILGYFGILVSMYGILILDRPVGMPILIAGNGIINGIFALLMAVTWPRFFGLKNLGSISGFVLSCTVIGSALGPHIFSLSEKYTGNYNNAVIVLGLITAVLFFMSFKANNVNDKKTD